MVSERLFLWLLFVRLCYLFFLKRAVLAVSETNFLPFLMFFLVANLNIHHCFGSLFLVLILLKVHSRFVNAHSVLVLSGLELIFFIGAGRVGVWSSWVGLSCQLGLTPNIQLLWGVHNLFSTGIAPIKVESSHSFECLSNF